MSNPTSNFAWQMPTATDLVTDLPADFEVFGQAVDSSMADLLGGTAGQILAKNTNANMDFVWITNDVGDITAVTAGTGITGGGTSGAVTITNDMATTITASGDIVVGTGSGTYDNLPIGTTGQILTADTTVSPYKVKWASPAGGGKVLQVVYGSTSTQVTNSTNSTVDTGLTATITPTSATSTILVLIAQQGIYKQNGNNSSGLKLLLVRSGTLIYTISDIFMYNNTSSEVVSSISAVYRDSPATTSARTYKTEFANYANAAAVGVQFVAGAAAMTSTITLLEIGA